MNKAMGTEARLMYSPTLFNCLANPISKQVVMGQPLQRYAEMQGPQAVGLGMGFLLAHEFGHMFQFKMVDDQPEKLGNDTPVNELQADVLAGYWAAIRIQEQREEQGQSREWENANKDYYLKAAGSLGDYAFFSPSHHGTPQQRYAAVKKGYNGGQDRKFGNLSEAYSDNAKRMFDWSREESKKIMGR